MGLTGVLQGWSRSIPGRQAFPCILYTPNNFSWHFKSFWPRSSCQIFWSIIIYIAKKIPTCWLGYERVTRPLTKAPVAFSFSWRFRARTSDSHTLTLNVNNYSVYSSILTFRIHCLLRNLCRRYRYLSLGSVFLCVCHAMVFLSDRVVAAELIHSSLLFDSFSVSYEPPLNKSGCGLDDLSDDRSTPKQFDISKYFYTIGMR